MTIKFDLEWKGLAASAEMRRGAVAGLRLATEHILGVSRQRVPLEEGTLERSGTASVDTADLKGSVAYDTPYAVRQHEELDWKHDEGRQAKYLESAFDDESETAAALIAAQIRRALGS